MTSVLVSRHHIKKSHALFEECDFLCYVSKNLYNHCLYQVRNYGFGKNDHGFVPSPDAAGARLKQQDPKNKTVENNTKEDDEAIPREKSNEKSNNDFFLGELFYTNRKGEAKTKNRFAFEATELYHAIKNSNEFRTTNHEEYGKRQINTKILKQTVRQVGQDFSNFFASMRAFKQTPSDFLKKPQLPDYKTVGSKGRTVCTIPREAISVNKKKNLMSFGLTRISLPLSGLKDIDGKVLSKDRILEAKIVPLTSGYDILISYFDYATKNEYKLAKQQKKDDKIKTKEKLSEKDLNKRAYEALKASHVLSGKDLRVAGGDLGTNNIISLCGVNLSSDNAGINPLIVNGRHIKSINQYYNQELACLKSHLAKNTKDKQKTSRNIKVLTQKRNHKIQTELHRVSKFVASWCVENSVSCLIIGKNDCWKTSVNIGSRNNQNFVFIPHAKLIDMVRYKCARKNILVLTTEESYTSKCSFLDKEQLRSHTQVITDDFGNQVKFDGYQGRRVKRGLFKSAQGKLINADIQGSLNMTRKVVGDDVYASNSIEAFAVTPVRVCLSA